MTNFFFKKQEAEPGNTNHFIIDCGNKGGKCQDKRDDFTDASLSVGKYNSNRGLGQLTY